MSAENPYRPAAEVDDAEPAANDLRWFRRLAGCSSALGTLLVIPSVLGILFSTGGNVRAEEWIAFSALLISGISLNVWRRLASVRPNWSTRGRR